MNKNVLLGKMVTLGYTQLSLAKAIGMSKNTLNAKINGKRPFNSDEILDICNILKISCDTEKVSIFLSPISQYRYDMPNQHTEVIIA